MTEEKAKENAEKKIQETQDSIEDLKLKLAELTAEFRQKQKELNEQIYAQGEDEFSDIDLPKLLTTGVVYHKANVADCEFVLKTLTKGESLDIDKRTKDYISETNDFYTSSIQSDILSYSLKEYNGHKAPTDFEECKKNVGLLSDQMVNLIFSVYNRMSRWIRAALELNLKN